MVKFCKYFVLISIAAVAGWLTADATTYGKRIDEYNRLEKVYQAEYDAAKIEYAERQTNPKGFEYEPPDSAKLTKKLSAGDVVKQQDIRAARNAGFAIYESPFKPHKATVSEENHFNAQAARDVEKYISREEWPSPERSELITKAMNAAEMSAFIVRRSAFGYYLGAVGLEWRGTKTEEAIRSRMSALHNSRGYPSRSALLAAYKPVTSDYPDIAILN